MGLKSWALEMARYNRWQDECIYEVCSTLSEDDRKLDRCMFFGSIQATLNHILVLDGALAYFCVTGKPPADLRFNETVHTNFEALRAAQNELDEKLESILEGEPETWFDDTLVFESERLERTRSLPRWFYWAQLFNHATHHRSQITSKLHELGIEYGITDLPYNPYSPF